MSIPIGNMEIHHDHSSSSTEYVTTREEEDDIMLRAEHLASFQAVEEGRAMDLQPEVKLSGHHGNSCKLLSDDTGTTLDSTSSSGDEDEGGLAGKDSEMDGRTQYQKTSQLLLLLFLTIGTVGLLLVLVVPPSISSMANNNEAKSI